MPNNRVFVPRVPRPNATSGWTPNLKPAESFGELHFVLGTTDNPQKHTTECFQKALQSLRTFNHLKDYIMCPSWSTEPISFIMTLTAAAIYTIKKVNGTDPLPLRFLVWQKPHGSEAPDSGRFRSITINLNEGVPA